jgi:formate dehydrogenase subunit delta
MSVGKLVMMANQIGRFHASQRQGDPSAAIADHLRRFWDPGMRLAIVAHLEQGGEGLDNAVREAVRQLAERGSVKST